jgi:hypothetical protein
MKAYHLGLTNTEIGKLLGVDRTTVADQLNKMGH